MYIFKPGSKFTYKGAPNDDLPTITSIFKKQIMYEKSTRCKDLQRIRI